MLLSLPAHSANCGVDTSVYFGNGVVTTIEDARRNARITGRAVVREAPSEGCRFEFKVAYNQSSGLLLDMLEAARQTLGNEYPTLVMAFILQKAGLPNSIFAALLPAGALQTFNEQFRDATVQSLVSGSTSSKTLTEHVGLYTTDLQTTRVILLSHSQGNIYANLAAESLSSQNPLLYTRFAIIPVASPEYYCAKCLVGHVRFSDDLVIGTVAVARSLLGLPAPLDSNDSDGYDVDFWSHYYLEAYYTDDSSRQFIINSILETARLLPGAPAAIVTYDFEGEVTSVSADFDPAFWADLTGAPIARGTRFTGEFTYDPGAGVSRTNDFNYFDGAVKNARVVFAGGYEWIITPSSSPGSNEIQTGTPTKYPDYSWTMYAMTARSGTDVRLRQAIVLGSSFPFIEPPGLFLPSDLPSPEQLDARNVAAFTVPNPPLAAQVGSASGRLTVLTRR